MTHISGFFLCLIHSVLQRTSISTNIKVRQHFQQFTVNLVLFCNSFCFFGSAIPAELEEKRAISAR